MKIQPTLVRRCRHAQLMIAALACLLFPLNARAQPASAPVAREQFVEFSDDLLNADLSTPYGIQIFPPHLPPARTLLIRPRTNFVPELYESVERL